MNFFPTELSDDNFDLENCLLLIKNWEVSNTPNEVFPCPQKFHLTGAQIFGEVIRKSGTLRMWRQQDQLEKLKNALHSHKQVW